mgnify:FL=1
MKFRSKPVADKVLERMTHEWTDADRLAARVGASKSRVRQVLADFEAAGIAERRKDPFWTKRTQWRLV